MVQGLSLVQRYTFDLRNKIQKLPVFKKYELHERFLGKKSFFPKDVEGTKFARLRKYFFYIGILKPPGISLSTRHD